MLKAAHAAFFLRQYVVTVFSLLVAGETTAYEYLAHVRVAYFIEFTANNLVPRG
jgi:hypothetical protein